MAPRKSILQIADDLRDRIAEAGVFWIDRQPARLGNYAGVVSVPGKHGIVYARLESGHVVEVLNTVAPNIPDWAVYVGRDKSQPSVYKVIETRWIYNLANMVNYIVFHHKQHEFPNPDTVFVHRDQFLPLLVYPAGGLTAQLFGDMIYVAGAGVPVRVPDTLIDMTSYVPASGATYVLLEVEYDGTLNYVSGSNVASRDVLLFTTPLPAPSSAAVPICAFAMFAGQTEIRRDAQRRDIIDLRMFTSASSDVHSHTVALDDLDDVDATAPENGMVVAWNEGVPAWVAVLPTLDFLSDVTVGAPTEGQVLTWDDTAEEWIAADPTGGGSGSNTLEDLTPQIPAASDHFDLTDEATGDVLLFYNGVYQPPSEFTMDVDNLGLTTDFSPASGDTLVAVYGVATLGGGGGSGGADILEVQVFS